MADKSLGQHWLFDTEVLRAIASYVEDDVSTIVEIGPGLGTLTQELIKLKKSVVALELDERLLDDLEDKFRGYSVTFLHQDVLKFDFSSINGSYNICANIPYYLTSHLMRILTETSHKPIRAALLVQKEVAERIAARAGNHSILSITMQLFADVTLGIEVPARLFSPPPKVDSQVVILDFYGRPKYEDISDVIKVVKAGFSSPRKKLRSSLSAGLGVDVIDAEKWLLASEIDPGRRAQTLELDEWATLTRTVIHTK